MGQGAKATMSIALMLFSLEATNSQGLTPLSVTTNPNVVRAVTGMQLTMCEYQCPIEAHQQRVNIFGAREDVTGKYDRVCL